MEDFQKGFISLALESGLTESQATHFWKQAQDLPHTEQVFKQLGADAPVEAPAAPEASAETIAKLEEQKKLHDELMALKQQLGI
jgi:hypothetical protein